MLVKTCKLDRVGTKIRMLCAAQPEGIRRHAEGKSRKKNSNHKNEW